MYRQIQHKYKHKGKISQITSFIHQITTTYLSDSRTGEQEAIADFVFPFVADVQSLCSVVAHS